MRADRTCTSCPAACARRRMPRLAPRACPSAVARAASRAPHLAPARVLGHAEELHNVRVAQPGEHLEFALHHACRVLVVRRRLLDGHAEAVERRLAHEPERAAAEWPLGGEDDVADKERRLARARVARELRARVHLLLEQVTKRDVDAEAEVGEVRVRDRRAADAAGGRVLQAAGTKGLEHIALVRVPAGRRHRVNERVERDRAYERLGRHP
mmetsp:Transcript_12384/g.29152  ORF Transcript_12384/g.29152 Transcript_12384/m.29152 type:complete len:212 (-) Transcript_12384:12-647(-)